MSKRNGNGAHTLKLDPHNARKHPDRNKAQIAASLKELGAGRSILVDATGTIIAGNGVYEQAQALGYKVKVIEADGKTLIAVKRPDLKGAKARRMALADNRATETSEWDVDVLADLAANDADALAGLFDERELRDLLGDKMPGGKEETADAGELVDKAAELQAKWQVARGDVWQVGRHRVMCGDSTNAADVAKLMQGERAQAAVTSPPYPGADMWDDSGTVKQIEQIGLDVLRVVVDFIDDGCAILWNIANTPIGTQAGVVHTTTTTTKHASESLGLLCYGEIIWAKPVQHLTPLAFMMRPVVPNLIHEYVMIFYKGKRNQRESKSGLTAEQKSYRTSSVWEISPESAKEIGHKAPFPVELATRCISLWSLEGDMVLEPFCGAGTTLVACEQTGRIGRGMEIEPKYVAVSLERLSLMGLMPKRVTDTNGNGKTKATA